LFIHASSSIHGISTDADGVEGSLELSVLDDGSIDVSKPVKGSLQFEIARLSSGNPLYDVETERRIEAKKYPHVEAALTSVELIAPTEEGDGYRYRVAGQLTLHGVTQSLEGEIGFRAVDTKTVQIWGEQVIDVRAWKINPPKLGLLKVHPDVRVRLEATART
jgi:polyisoprenoid-binding protein YceI